MDFETAAFTLGQRQMSDSLIKRQMIAIRDRYNGDWVIPMPEIEDEPTLAPAVPAMIADTIDSTAMRSTSTRPQVVVPAMRVNDAAMKRAENTRKAVYASWHRERLMLKLRRSIRHLVGYGTNVLGVVPCFEDKNARVEVRDPLTAYPDEMAAEEVRLPCDIGFIYPRSPEWIKNIYPEARDYVQNQYSEYWDLFEWIDSDNIYIGILGPRSRYDMGYSEYRGYTSGKPPLKLRAFPNRAGLVPFVCPGRVTLDRVAGQVTKMVGLVDMMSKLMALEVVAAEKGVFADKYILSKDQMAPGLANGNDWLDGRTGEVNLITGADSVGEMTHPLNPGAFQTIDRMERAIRMSSGQPGIFGGELTGNIRSGQTITQAGAYAVDPRVQEVQETLEYELSELNTAILEVEKGYWPNRSYTCFSGWPTEKGMVEYTPSRDFVTTENVVSYAFPGMDITQITVALGQMMQMKLIDRKSAQRKHPLVDNPVEAEQNMVEEALTDAVLVSFLTRTQQGTMTEVDVTNVLTNYRRTGDIVQAVTFADNEARKRQAAATTAPPDGGAPTETMPGLSPAGTAGAEAQAPGGATAGGGIQALLASLAPSGGGGGAPVPAGGGPAVAPGGPPPGPGGQ